MNNDTLENVTSDKLLGVTIDHNFHGRNKKNQEVHHYNTRFAHHYRSIKYKSDKMKYSIKGQRNTNMERNSSKDKELFITT